MKKSFKNYGTVEFFQCSSFFGNCQPVITGQISLFDPGSKPHPPFSVFYVGIFYTNVSTINLSQLVNDLSKGGSLHANFFACMKDFIEVFVAEVVVCQIQMGGTVSSWSYGVGGRQQMAALSEAVDD